MAFPLSKTRTVAISTLKNLSLSLEHFYPLHFFLCVRYVAWATFLILAKPLLQRIRYTTLNFLSLPTLTDERNCRRRLCLLPLLCVFLVGLYPIVDVRVCCSFLPTTLIDLFPVVFAKASPINVAASICI